MPWVDGKNTWLAGLSADEQTKLLAGVDPVSGNPLDKIPTGGSVFATIERGEFNDTTNGIVNWLGYFVNTQKAKNAGESAELQAVEAVVENAGANYNPAVNAPAMLFNLSIDDPRYKACLKIAQELKNNPNTSLTGLDPSKPDDYAKITERESSIVNTLSFAIHEQYGIYNPILNTAHSDVELDIAMHNDVDRATQAALEMHAGKTPKDIPAMTDFAKNELICRQFAPLASRLLAIAGLPHFAVAGDADNFDIDGETVSRADVEDSKDMHVFCVSRLTGNIIEATDDKYAYLKQLNHVSMKDFLLGGTVITGNSDMLLTYGTAYTGVDKAAQDNLARVQKFYDATVKPQSDALDAAIAKGDVGAFDKISKALPIGDDTMTASFYSALDARKLPLAQYLADQPGVIMRPDHLASDLTRFIATDKQPDVALYKFIADKGALSALKLNAVSDGGLYQILGDAGISSQDFLSKAKAAGYAGPYEAALQMEEKTRKQDALNAIRTNLLPHIQAVTAASVATNYAPTNVAAALSNQPAQKQH